VFTRDESEDGFRILSCRGLPCGGGGRAGSGAAQSRACGMNRANWCSAPAGDPCGRHRHVAACRADLACYGMPYQGDRWWACQLDVRGFASNWPDASAAPAPRRAAGGSCRHCIAARVMIRPFCFTASRQATASTAAASQWAASRIRCRLIRAPCWGAQFRGCHAVASAKCAVK